MKVRYAVQVLSHSVAAAVELLSQYGALGNNGQTTAIFLERVNNLFDILNSSIRKGKYDFLWFCFFSSNYFFYSPSSRELHVQRSSDSGLPSLGLPDQDV